MWLKMYSKRLIESIFFIYGVSGLMLIVNRWYKVLVSPIILYACEMWSTVKEEETKLAVLVRKFMR